MQLTKEDVAFIAEMRAEGIKWKWLANAVYRVCNSKADTPPYLLQLAKDIKARHLNDDTTTES